MRINRFPQLPGNPWLTMLLLLAVFTSTATAQDYHYISLADILATPLSDQPIIGDNSYDNSIPTGTVVVYRTNEGRYGKLLIEEYGYNLTLRWMTYQDDGQIYSTGHGLVIHGTWSCDLDEGVEPGGTGLNDGVKDFWWHQLTSVEREIQPLNSATFALYDASPDNGFAWMQWQIDLLIAEGILDASTNAANHLYHYLDRARETYEMGMMAHSSVHLSTLISKVERLLQAHRVPESWGQGIIAKANHVIGLLQDNTGTAGISAAFPSDNTDSIFKDNTDIVLQNSPNPFNPTTTIRFTLTESAPIRLAVYDLAGREIAVLVDGYREAGLYEMPFDGSGLSSGTYLYRLLTPNEAITQKMVLLQ